MKSPEILYTGWDSAEHKSVVNKIAEDIIRQQDTHNLKETALVEFAKENIVGDDECTYERCAIIEYDDLKLDWFKHLTVCISTNSDYRMRGIPLHRDERNQSYIIGDTEDYSWNDNVNIQ